MGGSEVGIMCAARSSARLRDDGVLGDTSVCAWVGVVRVPTSSHARAIDAIGARLQVRERMPVPCRMPEHDDV